LKKIDLLLGQGDDINRLLLLVIFSVSGAWQLTVAQQVSMLGLRNKKTFSS